MRKLIIGLLICFIAIYSNPCSAFGLEEDLYGKEIILKEYHLDNNLDNILKDAQIFNELPTGEKISAFVNGQKVNCYVVKEKFRDILNLQTNQIENIYRITVFATDSYTDEKNRTDPAITTRAYVRAYFAGSQTRDGMTFNRISKWEGRYDRLDNTVTYTTTKVYARAFGETYNGTTIGNSPFNTAFTSRNIDTPGQWYTLNPYWSNEYIVQTPIMGQMGGTYIEIKRGTSNPWTLEVRIQDYGLQDWSFGG
ncbi:hypothetical protein [Thermosyntropha sp.]|uniref:hypothetical protein n=1 Tax=Thermosyntropha sp. TaxID=2740820 RepID=UPI0025EC476E|nr:hypothetical protein [Thermosyntropha sp.]MBO8158206.1 hypothetical protein [Thermosyntropha sp.]